MTFDIKAFEDFCRSKPAHERYSAGDRNACALAQFGYSGLNICNSERRGIPTPVYVAAVHPSCVDGGSRFTFGALADRLAALRKGKSA